MKSALFLVLLATAALAEYASYDGYTVYSVTPVDKKDVVVLQELYDSDKYDFWSKGKALNHPTSIMVSPELKETFTSILDKNEIQYNVLIENVETVVAAERLRQARAPRPAQGRINFEAYQRYDVILEYLTSLGEQYGDIVRVEDYGTSYEGRPLRLIRVGTNLDDPTVPTIFIEGAIHAREWIAPPVVLYTIEQLVENEENREYITNVNWILIPVVNPDGYEYSHTDYRMWRKTRSTGEQCYGVDGNRNFDHEWGGPGTSANECSEIYKGPYAFSEPEVAALAEVALNTPNIALYIAVHSFGNWILYPWGYTYEQPDNVEELHEVGVLFADAIEAVYGTQYVVGNSAALLYFAAGASDDWFKAIANAPLSYTLELPGGGNQGFDLPADRIYPVIRETWPGIVATYNYVVANAKK